MIHSILIFIDSICYLLQTIWKDEAYQTFLSWNTSTWSATPGSDGAVGVTCGVKASCECCSTCFFESQRVGVDFSEVKLGKNLCSDWVVPSTALTASWYTLENCQEVSRELGRKYGRWTRPSVMAKNVYCIRMHISYIIHISKYIQIKLYLLNDATSLITVACITLTFVDISDRVFRVSNAKHFWGETSAILKEFPNWIAPWQFSQKENTGHQNRCAQLSNTPWIISLGRDEKKKTRDLVSKYWFTIHSTPSHRGHYQPKQCIVIREIPHRFELFDSPQNG